jgi:cytochrome c peroxidase
MLKRLGSIRGLLPVMAAGLLLVAVGVTGSMATPVKQAPWRPDAAAYRTTLFLADLAPTPWESIAAAWSEPHPGAAFQRPAVDLLNERAGGAEATQAIQAAIEANDSQALFEAATRAIAGSLIDRLEAARSDLTAGGASTAVAEARELYRAFEDGIAAGDPDASRRIGMAWLALSSSAGTRGVLGAGARAADAARFEAAVAEIRSYVAANFNPVSFTPRRRLTPLPETVVATQGEVAVPPVLPPAAYMGDQSPLPRLVLNFEEQGIEESDLPLVAYGDMLFDSAQIFGDPARSLGIACSTCHNRSDVNRDLFIPGVSHQPGAIDVDGAFFNHVANDLRDDPIDIPSLRGLRFTGPYGRDGRFASLRVFPGQVIVGEFAGAAPAPFMLDALVAYMLEFDFLPNTKLDAGGRLTDAASPAARRGEDLFKRPFAQMDGRACASCHVPSSNFLDRQAHDIGSVELSYQGARSGALDTPTLLASRFTAPYFHDGSQPTLASVVGWFDGSYGLGLSEADQSDLTAYLEAVGDADEPYEPFDERNTPFKLAFEELTTFASTLELLIPKRDAEHAMLLVDTVSADLAADASAMSNLAAKSEVYALAKILASVGESIAAADWPVAEARWEEFKRAQADVAERMF